MTHKISQNLQQRLIFSAVAIFLFLTCLYFSYGFYKIFFVILIMGLVGAGLTEFYRLIQNKGYQPLTKLSISCSCLYIFATFLQTQVLFNETHSKSMRYLHILPEAVLFLALILAFSYFFITGKEPFVNLAATFFGFVYLTVPLTCIIPILYFFPEKQGQQGSWWVLYLVAVTKMTDTGAYFCGKAYGSKKLASFISPGKTIEGAIGGAVFSLMMSLCFYLIINYGFAMPPISLTLWQSIGLSLVLSLLAQFGDLCESLLKRDWQVKDSNHLPGIGGILDLLDSLIFTIPFLYLFLKMNSNLA